MGNKGFLFNIIVSILVFFSTIYYARCYVLYNSLILREIDNIILMLLVFAILFICLSLIFIMIYMIKLRKDFIILSDLIVDIEDNSIEFQRVTQEIILKISKYLGVEHNEKAD